MEWVQCLTAGMETWDLAMACLPACSGTTSILLILTTDITVTAQAGVIPAA